MKISLIAAVAANGVIGVDGDLPWYLPSDLKFFARTTRGHHVLMGRKNFDSIPEKFRPLPDRPNLIVTRKKDLEIPGVAVFHSIESAIEFARAAGESELFVIGGGQIYSQCMHLADKLYITHVDASPEGDTYFPEINEDVWNKELVMIKDRDAVHNYGFKTYVYSK